MTHVMKQQTASRLAALRALMAQRHIDAVIIPQTDPHQSEYIADHWQVREYFSGFNGSAGTLVVTAAKCLLWTDSRYFLQAAQQLEDTEIILMKDGLEETPAIEDWLIDNLRAGQTVGIDGMVYSATATRALRDRLECRGIKVVTDFDAAAVWAERPALPQGKAFVHELRYAGVSADDKIAAILDKARASMAGAAFISALDEIAWTLNLRCNDVSYNPVLTAFLYLAPTGSVLFVDPAKITPEVKDYLQSQGVATAAYDSVLGYISALPAEATVLVEPSRNAIAIVEALGSRAIVGSSPVALDKACKNPVQIDGVHQAMLRDGAAMVRSLMEIEGRLADGRKLTELDVCDILRHYRSQSPLFYDESFGTIAGFGAHGAIVHYEPTAESNSVITTGNLLLIDSGAQYLDGTTDITRTICTGTPTAQQKRDFTLVMKGHIALATAIFPSGTTGHQLDVLARHFLWNEGLNYLHGTGHGVGHFLNVHEGPQSIRLNHVPTPLKPGMITSNEPGLYRENVHGIRCENLVLCVPAMESEEFGRFLRFETLTLCPFDISLFDTSIMTQPEIDWVNNYHDRVREALAPQLDKPAEQEWLRAHTAHIE